MVVINGSNPLLQMIFGRMDMEETKFELKDIHKIVEIVRKQNLDYWNKEDRRIRKQAIRNLNKDLSLFLEKTEKEIVFDREMLGSGVLGTSSNDEIHLPKASLITYLHEFFHSIFNRDEMSCRMLSTLVYGLAYPEKLENLVLTNGSLFTKKKFDKIEKKRNEERNDVEVINQRVNEATET